MRGAHNISWGGLELVIIPILGLINPYFSFFVVWYLGLMLLRIEDPGLRLALAPAFGSAVVIITMHVLSWAHLSLKLSIPIIYGTILFLWVSRKERKPLILLWRRIPSMERTLLAVSLLLSACLKIPFLRIPSYPGAVGSDALFHAYKSWEILREETVFISNETVIKGIIRYPAGYHSLVAWISLASNVEVPFAMMVIKFFTWLLLPLGTYAAAKAIFKDGKVAALAAIAMPLTSMYYYYLNYSLLHMFYAYYLFLAALSAFILALDMDTGNAYVLATLASFALLITHPYPYLMFEAYAGFLVVLLTLSRTNWKRAWRLLVVQGVGSFLLYSILEYPIRVNVAAHTKPIFGNPAYAFKDNPEWLTYILKETFVTNGQLILLPFFIVGVYYSLRGKNLKAWAVLLTVLYAFFLIANKIWLHVVIPFYSNIWSSERIYVLIIPFLPILTGRGLADVLKIGRRKKIIGASLAMVLLVPLFYVNVMNYSREFCSTVDGTALQVFSEIRRMNVGEVYVSTFKDSGWWIPPMIGKKIAITKEVPDEGIVYIDSRGFGDVQHSTLNPLNFTEKRALILFRDGIWVFNLSKTWNESNPRALKCMEGYYSLRKGVIDGGNFEDWKYFVYGFTLRHPAIVEGIVKKEFNGAFSNLYKNDTAYVFFIPERDFKEVRIVGVGNAEVFINGAPARAFKENEVKTITVKTHVKSGQPYVIEFRGIVLVEDIILRK
ncbi:hypothetical protein [Palaeococcus sp. (in: euryarchaeotes)]